MTSECSHVMLHRAALLLFLTLPLGTGTADDLFWPIDCAPGDASCSDRIGYPDDDRDGVAHDCNAPGYFGHEGTDIDVRRPGVEVRAAASGTVLFAVDDHFDACPSSHPDCRPPPTNWAVPGATNGYRVCTPATLTCPDGGTGCFSCFDGGNVVVIEHDDVPGVYGTRYDHLGQDSVPLSVGDRVEAGQRIGTAASAGNSTGPHLHFETWGDYPYDVRDPWAGPCGTNRDAPRWYHPTPWTAGVLSLRPDEWRQIALPAEVAGNLATPGVLFGDDIAGQYGTDWTLFRFDEASQSYAAVGANDGLVSGEGYWIVQATGVTVTLDLPPSTSPTPTGPVAGCPPGGDCARFAHVSTRRDGGWLMLGNPFGASFDLSRVRVVAPGTCRDGCTLDDAAAADLVHDALFAFDGIAYQTIESDERLPDWSGAWVRTLPGAHEITLDFVFSK